MKKILIVENDPILRGIYRRKFDLSGFVVEAVDDGPAALDTIARFQAQPDPDGPVASEHERHGADPQDPGVEQFQNCSHRRAFQFLSSRRDQGSVRRRRQQVRFQNGLHAQSGAGNRGADFQRGDPGALSFSPGKLPCSHQHAATAASEACARSGAGARRAAAAAAVLPVAAFHAARADFAAKACHPPVTAEIRSIRPCARGARGLSRRARKMLPSAPLIKMPKPAATGQGIPAPTPTPMLSATRVSSAPKIAMPPGAAPARPETVRAPAQEAAAAAEERTERAGRPDFGSDATSAFPAGNPAGISQAGSANPGGFAGAGGRFGRSKSTTEQLSLLQGFNTSISSLVGLAGITGFSRIAHLAGAMEALIKDLQKRPKQLTSSVLRTIAHASDCLNVLFRDINQGTQEIPQSLLILAVDDEPISRRTISVALAKANLRCICIEESKMAMTILGENQFDLVFLDAEMPEMNGFELCAELRKTATNKATPVIFVTSLTNFEVRAQSSLAGANDLIAKPFLMMELAVKALTYLLRPKSIIDIKSSPGGN